MKTVLLAMIAICFDLASARAQGRVNFATKVSGSGVDAKFFDCLTGLPATSPGYSAALEIDDGVGNFSLVPGSVTPFRTGIAAGYVIPKTVHIPGAFCGSSVTLRVVAFNGASEALPKQTLPMPLKSDSLIRFLSSPLAVAVVSTLILTASLGYFVCPSHPQWLLCFVVQRSSPYVGRRTSSEHFHPFLTFDGLGGKNPFKATRRFPIAS